MKVQEYLRSIYVIGIDPGTTTAYAILTFSGEIKETKSSKNLGLKTLLEEISKYNNIVLIAVDKKYANENLIKNLSSKLGIGVFSPDHDLTREEKKEILKENEIKDPHIYDSIVAAMYAIEKNKKKVLRAIRFLEKKNRIDLLVPSLKKMFKEKNVNAAAIYEQLLAEKEKIKDTGNDVKKLEKNPKMKSKLKEIKIYPMKKPRIINKKQNIVKKVSNEREFVKEFIILLNYATKGNRILPRFESTKYLKEWKTVFINDPKEIEKLENEYKNKEVYLSDPYLVQAIPIIPRNKYYIISNKDIIYLSKYFVVLVENVKPVPIDPKNLKRETTEKEIREAYEVVKKILWEHRKRSLPP